MSQSLDIRPGDVIGIAKKITESLLDKTDRARETFTELISTAGMPASGDQVSREAAKGLRKSGEEFERPTADTFQALSEAAQALIGVAQSFATADSSGGGALSLQAAAEALAPLTQVATTLPQMIAEAASATGEDLTADQDDQDDQDDGAEVPPQGATVV